MSTPHAEAPHCDAQSWARIVELIGPDSILVVINRWMSDRLRGFLSPEDVWQETLMHAWRDRGKHAWQDVRAYRAWVLSIARNRIHDAADLMRAKKRGGEVEIDSFSSLVRDDDQRVSSVLPGHSTTPGRLAHYRERAEIMQQALASLPAELEVVLRRHLFEGETMESIAGELEVPVSTAWSRFRKGSEQYARRLDSLRSRSRMDGPS